MSPETKEVTVKSKANTQITQTKDSRFGRYVSIIFLCFVASFLGAWVFLRTGLVTVDSDQVITDNRQRIVVQESEVMADVVKKVAPSVVSVVTKTTSSSSFVGGEEGAGTGIIISRDGYVITNKHVIGDASNVTAVSNDGTVFDDITVVGVDPLNDLAFLKINNAAGLQPALLANSSNVIVGQKVIAIGNALGQFQNSVTSGIISGRGRPVIAQNGQMDEQLDNLFQTDASINPGNSGGPLLNLSGEVVGINTAVAENAQGIGFAIPINAASGLIKGVLANGKVQRAYLGVRYVNITPGVVKEYKLSLKKGAYVFNEEGRASAVVDGSPAQKAGLKNKDIITKVNNQSVDENNGLGLLLSEFAPGDKVTLTVLRDGESQTLSVTLTQYVP